MDQKYGEFVGVDSLHYALLTANTEAEYTAGTPKALAPAAEVAASASINKITSYYDNEASNVFATESPTEIKVVVSNVPAELMAELLGKSYSITDGVVYDDGTTNPPEIALGFRYNMGKDGYRYYWYHVGTFTGGAEEAATMTENVDKKTYELTFTAIRTSKKFPVDGKDVSIKRVFGDTADANFNAAGWFDSVQLPPVV